MKRIAIVLSAALTITLTVKAQGPLIRGFDISPQNATQAEGVDANFQCQYIGASAVGWIVNGTSIYTRLPPNVSVSRNILDRSINVLTVLALPDYNETEVWCVATIFQTGMNSSGHRVEYSSKGMLIIQGPPDVVKDVTTYSSPASISLSWKTPFSQNLTTAEPDIAYCVVIYKVVLNGSSGEDILIDGDCNVFTSGFIYNSTTPDPIDHYKFVIVPRSNIIGAKNGTPSDPVIAAFLVHPHVCINSIIINTTEAVIPGKLHLIFTFPNWTGTELTVYIHEVDRGRAGYPEFYCVCMLSTAAVNCPNCSLYHFRKYSATVQCKNAIGISNSSNIILNTHILLNKNIIELNSVPQGEVLNVMCNSDVNVVTGCLAAIVSSDNRSELPLYRFIQNRNNEASALTVTIHGLRPNGNYTISLFEGLGNPPVPVRYPAVSQNFQPSSSSNHISINPEESIVESSILRSVIISAITNRLIVSSTLLASAQGFIVVYHQCTENNHSFTVSSIYVSSSRNQTVTCLDVQAGCYHVAVFGVTAEYGAEKVPASVACIRVPDHNSSQTAQGVMKCTINYIFVSLFSISTFAVTLLSFGLICQQVRQVYKKKKKTNDIQLQRCDAYEVVTMKRQ